MLVSLVCCVCWLPHVGPLVCLWRWFFWGCVGGLLWHHLRGSFWCVAVGWGVGWGDVEVCGGFVVLLGAWWGGRGVVCGVVWVGLCCIHFREVGVWAKVGLLCDHVRWPWQRELVLRCGWWVGSRGGVVDRWYVSRGSGRLCHEGGVRYRE